MTSVVRIPPELQEAIDRAYRLAADVDQMARKIAEGQPVMTRPEFTRMLIAEGVDARLRIGRGSSPALDHQQVRH